MTPWRSVFERRAPQSIETVEARLDGSTIGKGNTITAVTDELLDAVYGAYLEANGRTLPTDIPRSRTGLDALEVSRVRR